MEPYEVFRAYDRNSYALTYDDYAQGRRNYDAAMKGTSGLPWRELSSIGKRAWAQVAHDTPPAPRPTARFIVMGTTGGTQEVEATTMHEALNKTYIQSDRILSITRVA